MNVSQHYVVKYASSFAVGCACCLLAVVVHAQPSDQQIIRSYRDTDIRVLIEDVHAITDRTMIVDDRVRALVTLDITQPMTPDAFWDTFVQILHMYGFMAVEYDDVVHILPDPTVLFVSRPEGSRP